MNDTKQTRFQSLWTFSLDSKSLRRCVWCHRNVTIGTAMGNDEEERASDMLLTREAKPISSLRKGRWT